MSYVKLDTAVVRNLKLIRCSADARWLWLQGLAYCQDAKTDGFIHDAIFLTIGAPVPREEWAQELVASGLWHRVENGYEIHDYLQWNDSREKREQIREDNRRRKAESDSRLRGTRVIDVGPSQRRLAEPEAVAPVEPKPERRSLIDSPVRQMATDAKYGFLGPRFRVPISFHQELVGRYGGDMAEAESALQKWYRSLEASLLPGEAIPNIYQFINPRFAAWVAERGTAALVVAKADDQRQRVTPEYRAQLEAAQARKDAAK